MGFQRFEGKLVIVTGAGSGMGRRNSPTLSDEGAAVARGVTEELGGVDLADLTSQRDDALLALLQLKADADRLP